VNTLLCVDDEPHILSSLKRLFYDLDLEVLTATTALQAMEVIQRHPISVILCDNMMPGMTGIEFFQMAKELSPDSVRIMITGHANVRSAINAINKGEVYRFITKPWDDADLREVVLNAFNRYQVINSLKKADEATLRSLAQTVELKDHYTRGHCDRVAYYATKIAAATNLPEETKKHIRYGSWLHDVGKIGVPESILNYQGLLTPEQMEVVKNHCWWGAEVARQAQLPETVIRIILYHHERYDGQGYPVGLRGVDIPLEARIVTVADIYDALTTDRPYQYKNTSDKAKQYLINLKDKACDPDIVDIFLDLLGMCNYRGIRNPGE
jgi:putative two-component system response regulator